MHKEKLENITSEFAQKPGSKNIEIEYYDSKGNSIVKQISHITEYNPDNDNVIKNFPEGIYLIKIYSNNCTKFFSYKKI